MNSRRDSASFSASGTQSEDYESHYIEITKEKKRIITLDYKLYEKLITFFNANNNILMNIKNQKDIIKYSQETQTEEDIIKNEAKRKIEQMGKEIISLKEENMAISKELEKYKNL